MPSSPVTLARCSSSFPRPPKNSPRGRKAYPPTPPRASLILPLTPPGQTVRAASTRSMTWAASTAARAATTSAPADRLCRTTANTLTCSPPPSTPARRRKPCSWSSAPWSPVAPSPAASLTRAGGPGASQPFSAYHAAPSNAGPPFARLDSTSPRGVRRPASRTLHTGASCAASCTADMKKRPAWITDSRPRRVHRLSFLCGWAYGLSLGIFFCGHSWTALALGVAFMLAGKRWQTRCKLAPAGRK